MAGSADQRASRRHATAAAGGRWAGRALTTIPGGGKDTEAHASARAAVRAAATAACAALAPCDILHPPPPGGDQELAADLSARHR